MTRMGRAIRYVPYPVVGGFLGATGCLILLGAVRVITGHRLQFGTSINSQTLDYLRTGGGLRHGARAVSDLASLPQSVRTADHSDRRRDRRACRVLAGRHLAGRRASVRLDLPAAAARHLHAAVERTRNRPLSLACTARPLGNLIAVIFVTASSALFNTTGIEVAIHREANLERELSVTGLANMLSGAFGGYTGCISISRSVLNFNSGGSGRLSGLTVAAISALMLAVAPTLLGYMPKFVLGGLLIYLGADQLHKWIVQSRRRLSLTEYLSLLAIIVIIVQWGFIAGILIGIVIGCATFALSASRIDSIKYSFDGSEYRSSLDRSRDDQAVLAAHGGKIQGLNLQSYLFFGSANRLYQHVKALLARHPECRFLVFDFKLVTGIDSSAAYSFAQIKRDGA